MEVANSLSCLLLYPSSLGAGPVPPLIAAALREAGVNPVLPNDIIKPGADFTAAIWKAIERADFIIADLTGSNPNVIYEIGLAHALRKPVHLIAEAGGAHIPAAFSGEFYLIYDPAELDKLRNYIQVWARRYLKAA